jgi:hypothetical protein
MRIINRMRTFKAGEQNGVHNKCDSVCHTDLVQSRSIEVPTLTQVRQLNKLYTATLRCTPAACR